MKLSVLFIFFLQVIRQYDFVFNQVDQCNISSYFTYGIRIQSGIFHTVNQTGLLVCSKECMLRASCNSFNYHQGNMTCELSWHTSTSATAQLTTETGYQQSDISLWQQNLSGQCASTSCPQRHKCAELTSGNTVCLISECEAPPNVSFSTADLTERGVSITINYACDEGYSTVGNPTITCKANGLWTQLNLTCTIASGFITSPNGEVRLFGHPDNNVGRVEIFKDQQWGTVCDDQFDDVDATVICKELGFLYGKSYCCGHYGSASDIDPIWMDDVSCYGNETSITQCPHTSVHNCFHSEDAGVSCHV